MQVKKQQLELDVEQQIGSKLGKEYGSKLGKEYIKAVYCHFDYLTYVQSTSCKMQAGWSTSWIKNAGRNINISDKQLTPSLWEKVKKN